MDLSAKLEILGGSAKYDASCASSGSRRGPGRGVGSTAPSGICHSFSDDGRCVSLLKVLFTNACIHDCAYCVNRATNPVPRASFTVEELVRLTLEFYRRNYIEGLFLSSGVAGSADRTMERLLRVARSLRLEHGFGGYIHLKILPGASEHLIREAGRWADRLSANIELPSAASLGRLAPGKTAGSIFGAMGLVRRCIVEHSDRPSAGAALPAGTGFPAAPASRGAWPIRPRRAGPSGRSWCPAGQSTQLIVGASPERDLDILRLAGSLYRSYGLRRVYYSAYIPIVADPRLPALDAPPLRRENRLYQADWLLRFYGFTVAELADALRPDLDLDLDPKTAWALRHRECFPVEVQSADYERLLRIPGLGPRSAERILSARRAGRLDFPQLKGFGVVLKRAAWFMTCAGRSLEPADIDSDRLRAKLAGRERSDYGQLELFR